MKFNINKQVLCRLTDHGEAQWAAYWNRYTDYGGKIPEPIEKSQRLPDGRVIFQLHQLMHIFGPACYNGSTTQPITQNEIEIPETKDDADLKQAFQTNGGDNCGASQPSALPGAGKHQD